MTPTFDMLPPNSQNGIKAEGDVLFSRVIIWTGWLMIVKSKMHKTVKSDLKCSRFNTVVCNVDAWCNMFDIVQLLRQG